jgi:glucose dehydrogenase
MRRLMFLVVAAGLFAVTLVALATASHAAQRAAKITPTAEAVYPWLAPGVTPAGTTDNNWAFPNGDLMNTDYSMLKQINTSNVGNLKLAWQKSFFGPNFAGLTEGAPIVVSGANKNLPLDTGTMFLSAAKGAVALDPVTGNILWKYVGPNRDANTEYVQLAPSARAVSFGKGLLFVGQQDGSIVALNGKTGAPIWTAQVSGAGTFAGHVSLSSPFTTFYDNGKDGLVFAAPNYGDAPMRGHLDAYNARTGDLVWRWWTTPDPTQLPYILTWANPAEAALGGAAVWNNPSVDPQLGMVFTGTGNAYPETGRQPGKDLWTESLIALDVNTGALKWYYQAIHHDEWDYDCPTPTILFNMRLGGKFVPAFAGSCKTAYVYELNRVNGRPIFKIPEVPVPDLSGGKGAALDNTWPTQPEPTGGAAQLVIHCPTPEQAAAAIPTFPTAPDGKPIVPTCMFAAPYYNQYNLWGPYWAYGGTDYPRMAYSPQTSDLYVCANVTLISLATVSPTDYHFLRVSGGNQSSNGWTGSVSALNMTNNKLDWQVKYDAQHDGACYNGIISTAGGLVFAASQGVSTASVSTLAAQGVDYGGTFYAYDAKTGKQLWAYKNVDQLQASGPITYMIKGKQYVTEYMEGKAPATPGSVGTRDLLTTFSL